MQLRTYALVFGVLAWAFAASAAENVGTVSASGDVKVRGEVVPGAVAQGLVLKSGDEVETSETPAVILLNDQSRVTVAKDSLVKVVRGGGHMQVGLARGAIQFSEKPGSKLRICAISRLIVPSAPAAGSVTVESVDRVRAVADQGILKVDEAAGCSMDKVAAKWLTKTKAIVIVGAGAAAGTAAGVALTRPGPPPVTPPVSPH